MTDATIRHATLNNLSAEFDGIERDLAILGRRVESDRIA